MDYKAITQNRFFRLVSGRAVMTVVTALFIAIVVFFAIRAIPGDPALTILGTDSSPAERDQLREVMGLDQPIFSQFTLWLGQMLGGNLGYSYSQGRPVTDIIGPAFANTMMLGGLASVMAIIFAVVMGNLATTRWRPIRRATDAAESFFLSAPQYTVALVLLIVFAVVLPVFPAGGVSTRGDGGTLDILAHLFLPALALALAPGAQMARSLKTSIATLQSTDLLPTLRARGLSPWRLSVHAHHNALPPMITVLGIQVGTMLGGALFVEQIFSIPGLGALIVQSVTLRDYTLVQAVALIIAMVFVVVLLVADVVNALLDPRIRKGRA
ncbi:ABC transporter permease [Microbacterium sp. 77mftsu3.1]|uniref:ABC transporter permease n=1 Tax=Microbacterium sp. 77mftsu3.1 TaxID=1761802 RepID=UPI00035E1442|nr:ABC transporter permease [Microbacterium sp. 77mftsu3.1]SDG71648.1 peptide/nickel transport system permease protein [Microbacterium sp. 77mftsu3.1]